MIKKIATNTLANYILKGLQLVLNLVAIPILVHKLGEEGFGIILFAGVIVGYFNVLELGISDGVTKYVAQYLALKNYEKLQKIINSSLNLFLFIGVLVAILIVTWSYLGGVSWFNVDNMQESNYTKVFIAAGFVAITSWPQILLKSVFKGIQDFVTLNIMVGVGRLISVGLAILVALYTEIDIVYIFLLFNLDKVVLTFWQYWVLKKKLPFWSFKLFYFDKPTFRFIFSFSGWIMLGQLAVLLEYQADQLIIISFLSASYITVYAVIFYLFRIIQQISGLAASAVMPAISQMNETKDKSEIKQFVLNAVKVHSLIYVPITIVLFFMAEPFIRLWMGEKYLQYIVLIRLSIAFQLVWQSGAMFGQLYVGLGFSKKPGLIAIIVGVSNVILSIILVKYIGIAGVVLGTICIGTLSVPFVIFWMIPDIDIKPSSYFKTIFLKTQLPLILASSFLFVFFNFINQIENWIFLALIAVVFYLYLLVITFLFIIERVEFNYGKGG